MGKHYTIMDDRILSFVDVETTGGSPLSHRVIDVAIIQVQHGRIIREFQSLVQPHQPIPQFIETLTGISADMLADAPNFEDIAEEISSMLEGTIFVAHNVQFDYSFLKQECARAGFSLNIPQLCTVRLSRHLFPTEKKHNLDIVIRRNGLEVPANRHRAYADTRAIADFYLLLRERFPHEILFATMEKLLKKYVLPSHMQEEDLEKVPERPGIYVFHDQEGTPLYIGKSIHLKERVCQHFAKAHHSAKELALVMRTHTITWEETVSELGALLLESKLVKEQSPHYNRRLRRDGQSIALKTAYSAEGYLVPTAHPVSELKSHEFGDVLGMYRSVAHMRKQLATLHKEQKLCSHMLGLSKGTGPCFSHSLGNCAGPCAQVEAPSSYNARAFEAFSTTRLHPWPSKTPLLIRHIDEEGGRVECVIAHDWCILGVATYEGGEWTRMEKMEKHFDKDVYLILRQFLKRPDARGGICTPIRPNMARGEMSELLTMLGLTDLMTAESLS